MVGEIRDLETAEIAIKAAQTGHMVLSTLHTNDAPSTLTRLMNMGIPTFNIAADGTVDWPTFSGYRRYSAECHVCHGPDGEGSTYAPALKDSVLRMDYYDFQQIVASGKQDVNAAQNQVMPAFGTNKNVWCYIDDIYVYLLARGTDAIPRGRPANKEAKSPEFTTQENSCMDG